MRYQHLVRCKSVVERQRRAVANAFGNGILVQVAFVILAAEGLEGTLAVDGLVHRGAGKADITGVRQPGHEEVTEVTTRCAVRLVDQDIDVRAGIDIGRHIAELVDHGDDDAPVVVTQKLVEPGNAGGMFQIAQPQRSKIFEHLVFQLVPVDHQEDGRLLRLRRTKEQLRRLDHGEGLAAPLGMPDETASASRIEGASDHLLHRAGLVLAQDVFVQLLVLLGKEDVLLQEVEHLRDGAEALHLRLQLAHLPILPVEDVPPHRVPTHPIGKADSISSSKELLRHKKLGRLAVVAPDLIHPEGNRLLLAGILALDHQHGNAVDEKNDILPRAIVAVVKGPLLRDFVHVPFRFIVIDQDQVALAIFLMVEELAPVAQVLNEFAVAVNVGMKMAELPEQGTLGLGIARVELANLRVEQVVEKQARIPDS